jgi:uncharacterized protein (DUF488 family)
MTESVYPIFTIGYATLTIERFIELLHLYHIEAVADVRSQPYSRYTPEFTHDSLKSTLSNAGIQYVFLRKELGARRDEPECYVDGKVRYGLVVKTRTFKEGISRLEEGRKKFRISLLCAEKDPLTCHRTILVSRHLSEQGIEILHILHDGTLESQEQLEQRLLRIHGLSQEELFEDETARLSRIYEIQADKLAYVKEGSYE